MKYIASCSFGKDSLAMIIKIKELGLPLDEVIYCDIRFDNNISGELIINYLMGTVVAGVVGYVCLRNDCYSLLIITSR